jgi:hypothetical protein
MGLGGMLPDTKIKQTRGSHSMGDDTRILPFAEAVGNMGHWYWHIESNVVSWSDQVFSIFGCDPATYEPTFASFLDAMHPDDCDRLGDFF